MKKTELAEEIYLELMNNDIIDLNNLGNSESYAREVTTNIISNILKEYLIIEGNLLD